MQADNYKVELAIHKPKKVQTVKNDRMALTAVNTHEKVRSLICYQRSSRSCNAHVTGIVKVITGTYMYNTMQTHTLKYHTYTP